MHIAKYVKDLESPYPKIKYFALKELTHLAETDPDDIYPYYETFVKLLKSENHIMKWNSIRILGFLSKSDPDNHTAVIINDIFKMLNMGEMITANSAIAALGAIAENKPEYLKKILNELIKVDGYEYETGECHEIACGKVILELAKFKEHIKGRSDILSFIQKQLHSTRHATKTKAESLLSKLQ